MGSHEDVFAAALSADIPLLRQLLRHSGQTVQGRSPLWLAASTGNADVARVLLGEEVDPDDPDATGNTPLMCAASQGFSSVVTQLLRHGADALRLRQDGSNAVSLAAYFGRCDSLSAMFHFDPSLVQARDALGRTALHWAALGSQTLTAKFMIGRWAGDRLLCVGDSEANTPLHLCRGPSELLLLLLFGGRTVPQLEAKNQAGLMPLEAALRAGLSQRDLAIAHASLARPERVDGRIFSFVESSMIRVPPAQQRSLPWPRRME